MERKGNQTRSDLELFGAKDYQEARSSLRGPTCAARPVFSAAGPTRSRSWAGSAFAQDRQGTGIQGATGSEHASAADQQGTDQRQQQ